MIDPDSIVLKYAKNAKSLNLHEKRVEVVSSSEKDIVDLNKSQLRYGQGSHGGSIGKYISKKYAAFKQSLASYQAPTPTADLFVKGGFHRGLNMEIKGKEVVLQKSKSDPTPYWWLKVYKGIFGLNKRNLIIIQGFTTPIYTSSIMKHLRK